MDDELRKAAQAVLEVYKHGYFSVDAGMEALRVALDAPQRLAVHCPPDTDKHEAAAQLAALAEKHRDEFPDPPECTSNTAAFGDDEATAREIFLEFIDYQTCRRKQPRYYSLRKVIVAALGNARRDGMAGRTWAGNSTPCCTDGCTRLASLCEVHAKQYGADVWARHAITIVREHFTAPMRAEGGWELAEVDAMIEVRNRIIRALEDLENKP